MSNDNIALTEVLPLEPTFLLLWRYANVIFFLFYCTVNEGSLLRMKGGINS